MMRNRPTDLDLEQARGAIDGNVLVEGGALTGLYLSELLLCIDIDVMFCNRSVAPIC